MMQADLIITAGGLILLLISLVFLYVWLGKSKKIVKKSVVAEKKIENFQTFINIIKDAKSSKQELTRAVDMIVKDYYIISKDSESKYLNLIFLICIHPETDSQLVLKLEKNIREKNPKHAKEIEKALARGLAARG